MKCFTCEQNESEYNYIVKDGWEMPICKTCGEKLYGTDVGYYARDTKEQLKQIKEYLKPKKCAICDNKESTFDYGLVNGKMMPICEDCGEILFGTNIGTNMVDANLQHILLIEYVTFIKSMELRIYSQRRETLKNNKVLTLINKKRVG